ncbi:MAG: hypothetical protein ACXWRA_12415 [Pseudobdellovibrionaceae bacterium]
MSHKDDELNELLKPFRKISPQDLQMQKWQAAVQSEVRAGRRMITSTKRKWALQLVAAIFIGVIMGALLTKSFLLPAVQNPLMAQISVDNATFEHSHANLD